jgi:hypothetical protein
MIKPLMNVHAHAFTIDVIIQYSIASFPYYMDINSLWKLWNTRILKIISFLKR